MNLTFWMNMPSFYQADLFRALTKMPSVHLKVVFEKQISEDRRRLGWKDDLSGFEYEFLNASRPILDATKKALRYHDDIHIVGGLWAGRVQESILAIFAVSGARFFIYSESPDPRSAIPPWKEKALKMLGGSILRQAAGVLAISHFSRDYFRTYEIPNLPIHPFGYFRSRPQLNNRPTHGRARINVIFVGQLSHRKGLDILLSAIEPLFAAHNNLFLQIVGSGELEAEYRQWVAQRNLSRRVVFEGAIPPGKILKRISEADLLVLPSRWDGWGIVVNEALMSSVPVIVSDMCGAADIVSHGRNGFIFASEQSAELQRLLGQFVSRATLRRKLKQNAGKTGLLLSAESAAQYLVSVIGSEKSRLVDSSRFPWVIAKAS